MKISQAYHIDSIDQQYGYQFYLYSFSLLNDFFSHPIRYYLEDHELFPVCIGNTMGCDKNI